MTTPAPPSPVQPVKQTPKAAPRHRAGQPLPTDRLRLEVQLQILTAFARLSGRNAVPIATPAIAESVSVSAASAGLSNMFFVASGWLEQKGKQYAATPVLIDYYNRSSMSYADATTNLARAARQSWYALALLPRLESGPLTVMDVAYILTDAAAASPAHRPQIDMLIEWLRFLNLITVEDDKVTATVEGKPADVVPPAAREPGAAESEVPKPTKDQSGDHNGGTGGEDNLLPPIVNFDVSVKITAKDLRGLQPDQIKALFEAIGTVMSLTGTA